MNFIDKIKIKRNPNIIDSWSQSKINDETVDFAIKSGYEFNAQTINKFEPYIAYRTKFKYETEFLEFVKNKAKQNITMLGKISEIYGKEGLIDILKQDEELAKMALKHSKGIGLEEADLIQIIDGKDELIDYAIKNYIQIKSFQGNELAKYIAAIKTPSELQEMEANNSDFKSAFIELANPNKIVELLQDKNVYYVYGEDVKRVVKENLEQFIPWLEQMDELCSNELINDEIKKKTIDYLLENNIIYNASVPKFALSNDEYVLMCIEQEPTIIGTIMQQRKKDFRLEDYPEISGKIAKKILDEHIQFEDIPYEYQVNREIFESIIQVTPNLIQETTNRYGLKTITEGMTEQEKVDYYKSIDFPFNASTVDENNFSMVLECLKNDYMTLANFERDFTIEQYRQIYDTLSDTVTVEEILSSKFLTQNPYFVQHLLKEKVDLEQVNLQDTRKYEQFYLSLKATAIKNGIEIPEPKDYKDIINFNGNTVYVNLDNIDSVKKGLEYLKNNNIEQQLNVILKQGDGDEFVIADNLDFFEELQRNGVNINFKYSSGKKVFSLEEILKMEHSLQDIVAGIRSKGYSPLEQAIAVYDIAKVFKPYRHGEEDNTADSRALYEFLDNDYMVCAGYADLIVNLGHRLNASYCAIGLTADEPHARNYVNIVDEKYGVNGLYALEPTWEHNGRKRGNWEQFKSKYKYFLMTTAEGRKSSDGSKISLDLNDHGGYDALLTMQTPEEIQRYLKNDSFYKNQWFKRISILDSEFYKELIGLDFSKPEDINVLINYFKGKVNNAVPKEKLLDAIMEVKKSIYVDLSEQDFEDMRMGYSITEPFCPEHELWQVESLYGKEYQEYLRRRYEDIKSKTSEEAESENPCLIVSLIYKEKRREILSGTTLFGTLEPDGEQIRITDKKIIELARQNKDIIKQMGFNYIEYDAMEEGEDQQIYLTPLTQEDEISQLTLQERIENITVRLEQLNKILGVSIEKKQKEEIQGITTQEQTSLGISEINSVTTEMRRDLTLTRLQQTEIEQ